MLILTLTRNTKPKTCRKPTMSLFISKGGAYVHPYVTCSDRLARLGFFFSCFHFYFYFYFYSYFYIHFFFFRWRIVLQGLISKSLVFLCFLDNKFHSCFFLFLFYLLIFFFFFASLIIYRRIRQELQI